MLSAVRHSRLDYCNSVLANLSASIIAPLQSIENAVVRLVLGLDRRPSHLHYKSYTGCAGQVGYKIATLLQRIFTPHARPLSGGSFIILPEHHQRFTLQSSSTTVTAISPTIHRQETVVIERGPNLECSAAASYPLHRFVPLPHFDDHTYFANFRPVNAVLFSVLLSF